MTRAENILSAAFVNSEKYTHSKDAAYMSFLNGVEWAERNPKDTIDWQQVRIKASIAAMQGMLANECTFKVQ